MGNEDSTTSGKTIKERTVKKKAARSIVAPKTDEEITGRESRRRESFAAMNRQPVSERESRVIKTPGGMKVREESGKGVKMVTAPIRLTWNEDTLTPSQGTTRKVQATGWPETPPAPKKSGKEMAKTKTASQGQDDNLRGQQLHQDRQQQQIRPQQQIRSQEQGRPQQPVPKRRPAPDTTGQRQPGPNGPDSNMQPVPRIPETMEALKEMTGPLPDIKEELKRSNPAQQRYMPEAVRDRQNGSLTVRPMKEGPQKGMQGQQRTITGSYGQPHSDVAGLSSVKDTNLGNTSVWNPVEQEREPLNKENKRAADGGVTVPISMRDPERANTHTTVTNRIDREAVNEEIEHRGQRRILKTVVTTTTTTTYETVNDDDLREISAPPADTVTETVPVAKAPGPAGHPSARPGTRPAPGPGTRQGQRPQRPQNMRNPANRAGVVPGQPGQRRPAQNRPPMPNRDNMQNTGMMQNPNGMQNTGVMQNPNGMQNTGVMQNPNGIQNTGVMQNPNGMQNTGMMQNPNGMQNTGVMQNPNGMQKPNGMQNTGMMNKPPADRKPMSAMDRQLADIEKALGLAPEAPSGNPAGNTAGNPVTPQPVADNIGNNTAGTGVHNINNTAARPGGDQEKKQLNEDIFKGIDTFSKSPTVTIDEKTGQRNKSSEYVILAIEGVVFIIVLCICMMIYSNIRKSNRDSDIDIVKTETEETETSADEDDMTMDIGSDGLEVQEAGAGDEIMTESDVESGTSEDLTGTAASDSVDVDNDNFTLRCTNVTVVLDSDNNPAALIYFTFVNKTSKLLSMSEVFPPSVTQNGEACETSASLNEYPEEFYNKDTQISDGTSIDCCYAVSLKDAISPLQLTIHDNYEAFSDIGTTEIPLQ